MSNFCALFPFWIWCCVVCHLRTTARQWRETGHKYNYYKRQVESSLSLSRLCVLFLFFVLCSFLPAPTRFSIQKNIWNRGRERKEITQNYFCSRNLRSLDKFSFKNCSYTFFFSTLCRFRVSSQFSRPFVLQKFMIFAFEHLKFVWNEV